MQQYAPKGSYNRFPVISVSALLVAVLILATPRTASAILRKADEGRRAPVVVQGSVEGERFVFDKAKGRVYTLTKIRVRKALKGSVAQVIEVRQPGGKVGKYRLVLSDQPGFAKGEGVELYLGKSGGAYELVNGAQGKRHLSGPKGHILPSLETTASIAGHYKWSGAKWEAVDLPMPYWVNNQFTAEEEAVLHTSFSTWQDEPNSLMTYQYQGRTSRSSTNDPFAGPNPKDEFGDPQPDFFNDMTKGLSYPGSIATTYYWVTPDGTRIIEADIVFNYAQLSWSSDGTPGSGEYDLQNIATHEIGHTLVLDDLYPSGSPYYGDYTPGDEIQTMWGFASQGETQKRTLEAGDRAGIAVVYPNPYPRNVTGFTVAARDGQATLSWTNPTAGPFDGVLIVRKEGSAPGSTTDGTQIYSGAGTTWTDSGLTNGTTYYYRIYASAGGLYSDGLIVSATPRFVSVLALSASSRTITWGGSTVVRSSLTPTDTPAPSIVLKTSANGSSWSSAGAMTWDGSSHSLTVSPKALTYYRSVWPGDGTYLNAVSPSLTVRVRPKLATGLSSTALRFGQTMRISGYVYPPHDGSKVGFYWQRYWGGGIWKTYSATYARLVYNSPTRSKASSSYRPMVRGTWRARLRFGDSDHTAADRYSPSFTIR